ncbi:probable endopolygalacturonase II [Anoplophora glabripennis]|uniref:probable endopolygalacturonase II n=1 Tax=Anoplophora glabripennis TaxID=217634 RepID=UPI0008747FEF|nr:probable endopolygalacturonase II [Anoplophora glabripennis]
MRFFTVLGLPILGILVTIQPSIAATCTVSKYDEDNIKNIVSECKDITLDNLDVPAGVTLNLNLNPGTKLTFQGTITWGYQEWNGPLLNITGEQLEITGAPDHVIDPKGNIWWDGKGEHGGTVKPVFFVLHGLKDSVIHDLKIKNTPYHAIWIEHSDGVIASDVYIDSKDGDTMGGHNTDGFNVWTSNNVTLERITVFNQDDCIAIKSGTNVLVRDVYCYGGHGLSIGSVGGRDYNIVENVLVSNVEIENSDNGVRIKTVYGATGSVTNVTYEDIFLVGINNYGIIIEGDYNIDTGSPTGVATDGVPIKDFTLRNVTGTVKESGVNIYVLVKSASDWHWSDIDVTGGEQTKECEGIPEDSGISCE